MKLYPFQEVGAAWLRSHMPRRYLADRCGLGKTIQFCAAARYERIERTLVIAPPSAIENWKAEWKLWGPAGQLDVISWGDRKLLAGEIDGSHYQLVGVDEAHRAKNPRAHRTLAALNVARAAKRAWLLSATPMPNHPGELWSPLRALWPWVPSQLGIRSYDGWLRAFCVLAPGRHGLRVVGVRNAERLLPFLRQIFLRRSEEDVAADLPPLRVDVSLLPAVGFVEALQAAGVPVDALRRAMEAEDTEDGSLARLRRFLGLWKAPLIAQVVADELAAGEYQQIVIMAHHHAVLDVLAERLRRFGVVELRGGASPDKRRAAEQAFTRGDARVFIGQQQAAGEAINLQVSSEIILAEPDWSPDSNYQAIKRVHRMFGPGRPVRARVFAAAGTADEAVLRVEARKITNKEKFGL